jgi:predicted transcriptional regulator
MKQRSSFAITTLILETVAKSEPTGITKTKIMQNVMLNYKRVNRYCIQMIESGLIRRDLETRAFHITEKGKIVLQNCDELAQFMSPISELINKYRFTDTYYSPSNPDLIRTETTI